MRDRRQILIGLAGALGGAAALSSCDGASDDAILASLRPNGRLQFYSRGQFRLVGVISDAIVPRTDTPGAIDVGVPSYLDAMMKTWASDETKGSHRRGLRQIRSALGNDFLRLPDAERRDAVARLDAEAYGDAAGEAAQFYRSLKALIANVYYASEPGATQALQYELVPGRWLADGPISEIGRTWYD